MSNGIVIYRLGGIDFNTQVADGNGLIWLANFTAGRMGPTPDIKSYAKPQPGDWGSQFVPSRRNALDLKLNGSVRGVDREAIKLGRRMIAQILNLYDSLGVLTVEEITPIIWNVMRADEPLFKFTGDTLGEFEFTVQAPDPRAYSKALHSVTPGSATNVVNAGTAVAPVQLSVVGPAAGPITLRHDGLGLTVTVTTGLAGGQTLVVNLSTKTITVNGVPHMEMRSSGTRWWSLLPGNNSITYGGGGTPTLSYRDAWLGA